MASDYSSLDEMNVDGPSGALTAEDPDPYAGKEDLNNKDLMNQLLASPDVGDQSSIYKVKSDTSAASHSSVLGNIASLLTGDPRVGASVADHLNMIGVGKYDNSLGDNLQNFANLLTTQTEAGSKALGDASAKEADTANKAAAATSQKVEAQMIADAMQKSQSQSKGSGGGDSGGGMFGGLF